MMQSRETRLPKRACSAAVSGIGAALMLTLASSAFAQTLTLPSEAYGKVVLPETQSLGDAAAIAARNRNVFEPIGLLDRSDPLFELARSIVRVDIKLKVGKGFATSFCTGSLVAPRLILTNHHCFSANESRIVAASVVLDYVNPNGKGARRVPLTLKAVEADKALDFSLIPLQQPITDRKPIEIVGPLVKRLSRLLIIHHPGGRAKVMTRFRCASAGSSPANGPGLHHRCDTQRGSSGAIIFNAARRMVGLHHSGGLTPNDPRSYNRASLMASVLRRSRVLAQLISRAKAQPPTAKAPAKPAGTADAINTILKKAK
ncbi:MAG: serine protease [Pseudomonadota bacterium]